MKKAPSDSDSKENKTLPIASACSLLQSRGEGKGEAAAPTTKGVSREETNYPPPVTDREVDQFLRDYYSGKHPLPQKFKNALKRCEPAFRVKLAEILSEPSPSALTTQHE